MHEPTSRPATCTGCDVTTCSKHTHFCCSGSNAFSISHCGITIDFNWRAYSCSFRSLCVQYFRPSISKIRNTFRWMINESTHHLRLSNTACDTYVARNRQKTQQTFSNFVSACKFSVLPEMFVRFQVRVLATSGFPRIKPTWCMNTSFCSEIFSHFVSGFWKCQHLNKAKKEVDLCMSASCLRFEIVVGSAVSEGTKFSTPVLNARDEQNWLMLVQK